MHHTHNYQQANLLNFTTYGFQLEDDNLIKMSNEIDWEVIISKVETLYANIGRHSNSIRVMIALEMGKTYYGVSDKTIVGMLKKDVSLMILCGFNIPPAANEIPSSNSMTDFRNRLTRDVLDAINTEVIRKEIRKLSPRKRTQVASDTTCFEANIEYPTDVRLMTKVYKKFVKVASEIRDTSKDLLIRGKHKLKNSINSFNKKRRHTKTEIDSLLSELIKFSQSLYKKVQSKQLDLTKKHKKLLQNGLNIVTQQEKMLKTGIKSIPNRIVSFHEQSLRPIYRGKLRATTEFGKKTSIMVVGQVLAMLGECTYDNVSDSKLPKKDIKRFKEVTNRGIHDYSADRGMHSPKNHQLMDDNNIVDGIDHKGKIPKRDKDRISKTTRKRLSNQRQPSEGKLGTLKTRYGCKRIPYKADNTEVRLSFGILIHNLAWGIKH